MTKHRMQKRLADLHQDYESMSKFFLFASQKTKDKERKLEYERSAKICESMKEVCSLLFDVSKELLETKEGE